MRTRRRSIRDLVGDGAYFVMFLGLVLWFLLLWYVMPID